MPDQQSPAVSYVELAGISKSFGDVRALDDVTVTAPQGRVTAIVGENGAGKSTLMKVLSGVVTPDRGTVRIGGVERHFRTTRDATLAGVGMVYQETALVAAMSVWENVVLGWEPGQRGILRRKHARRTVGELAERYSLPVPLDAHAGDLPVSIQQQVEILKVLYRNADVVILDEPTSVLTPQEREGLFAAMLNLQAEGKTLLFISHKLDEVLASAHHVTVMRHGRIVSSQRNDELDRRGLARSIVGRDIAPIDLGTRPERGATVLSVQHVELGALHEGPGIREASFEVARGEVVGVAGVSGSGQHELLQVISGLVAPDAGTVVLDGRTRKEVDSASDPAATLPALRKAGMSHIPADRNAVGTLRRRPLWFSALVGRLDDPEYCRRGVIRRPAARALAERIIREGGVKASGPDALPESLSGGNLQKFIVQRELLSDPVLLVAEEPTHGIDIGAARDLRQKLRDVAADGGAVLLASTDLDELLETCDRIIVVFDGRIVLDADRQDCTEESLGAALTGLSAVPA
ncbi:ABC transporter ATP-binding protein [Actinoplanes bogorensis]|uniref:ABC transporter ATP-binding protein n=1 Tax=Paractinoplanes bogorensis TaxID=1610840 RepID=A0ABS5YJW2_9ACTN|nr:ABC transporter ATP-binding protein [Actinoplanes bogorensis]MBU2663776.1 ABC transporter ATP-binding protein [Actinoplanes bogorensis]